MMSSRTVREIPERALRALYRGGMRCLQRVDAVSPRPADREGGGKAAVNRLGTIGSTYKAVGEAPTAACETRALPGSSTHRNQIFSV